MYLARVVRPLWATIKDPNLTGQRILLVQPVTPHLEPKGRPVLCIDALGVGAGELVYFTKGKEASFPFLPAEVPTDMTIVGIVDQVSFGERTFGERPGAK